MERKLKRISAFFHSTDKADPMDKNIADLFLSWQTFIKTQGDEVEFKIIRLKPVCYFFDCHFCPTDKSGVIGNGKYKYFSGILHPQILPKIKLLNHYSPLKTLRRISSGTSFGIFSFLIFSVFSSFLDSRFCLSVVALAKSE